MITSDTTIRSNGYVSQESIDISTDEFENEPVNWEMVNLLRKAGYHPHIKKGGNNND